MSHNKNLQAFGKLTGVCTGYGGSYNPGQQNLQVEGLQTLLNKARTALLKVHAAKTDYENATNHREVIYDEVRDLVKRIIAELESSGVLPQTIADAHTMSRKIAGYRRSKAEPESSTPTEPVSAQESANPEQQGEKTKRRARGLDYASVADHFEKLVQTVTAEPMYQPGIPALKANQLKTSVSGLREANEAVVDAVVKLVKARMERNELFYGKNGSLYNTAQAVKKQVKAALGFSSEAYQTVRAVSLTKHTI